MMLATGTAPAPAPLDADAAFLADTWSVWFHDVDDAQWDVASYVRLPSVSTVGDVARAHRALSDLWPRGFFFVFREHVMPVYEDAHHVGCYSYKVPIARAADEWFRLLAAAVGETATAPGDAVTGVSLSPKRNFAILRVWLGPAEEPPPLAIALPPGATLMYRRFADGEE